MDKKLQSLIELQSIDSDLLNLERLKGGLPSEVTNLQQKLELLSSQIAADKAASQEAHLEKKQSELEVKGLEEQLDKYQQQIYQVKSNKEYDAITAEIETTEIEISDYETQILQLLEKEQELAPRIETAKQAQEVAESQLVAKENELKKLMLAHEKDVAEMIKLREKIIEKIPRNVLSMYDRVRKAKDGIAVVPLTASGNCGGCQGSFPPQITIEIRQNDRIMACQYCGRVLYYETPSVKEDTTE